MRRSILVFLYLSSVLVGCATVGPSGLQNVALKWSPTSTLADMGSVNLSGNIVATTIQFDTLLDTRANPALVAENRENAGHYRQMTTSTDVAAFVTAHMKASLYGAGLKIVRRRCPGER